MTRRFSSSSEWVRLSTIRFDKKRRFAVANNIKYYMCTSDQKKIHSMPDYLRENESFLSAVSQLLSVSGLPRLYRISRTGLQMLSTWKSTILNGKLHHSIDDTVIKPRCE